MSDIKLTGFDLLRKLGQGGMAVVWKARQLSLDRIVAIKLLPQELSHSPEEVKRIMTEARTAARLKHPSIVQVYDASEENGVYFFVMEYVDGYNVGQWIQRKKTIPWRDALLVAEYVAGALDYAWQSAGMIHCDIKPENIMVDQDGTIKVSDLGLSITHDTRGTELPAEIIGTPSYMAPEQVRGEVGLDCRTDIYALGATLYHMVTGRRMFCDVPDRQAMDCQLTDQVPDPQDVVAEIPAPVCSLIERMLVKDREGRPRDWAAVLADLRRVQRGLMPAGKPPPEGASSVKRKRVRIRREGGREDQRPNRSIWWLRGSLLLVTAIVAVLAWQAPLLRSWWERRAAPFPMAPVAPAPTDELQPREQTGQAQAMAAYRDVERWVRDNPQRAEEGILRFRKVINQFPGTPEAALALDQVKLIRVRRDRGIEMAWQNTKAQADAMAAQGQYLEAVQLLDGYSGPWASQTASNRSSLAASLRLKSLERDRARVNEENWQEWLKGLAVPLIQGRFAAAQEAVAQVQAANRFAAHKAHIEGLAQIMQGLDGVDDRVIRSFLKQTGTVVRVRLGRGELSVVVVGLSGRKVRGRTLDGQAEVLIGCDELSASERLARMGDVDSPESAIAKGVASIAAGKPDEAEACFAKAGPLLSGPLLGRLGDVKSSTPGGQAEAALAAVIKLANVTVPAYSEKAWLDALSRVKLNAARAAEVSGGLDRFLEKYGKSDFAERAAPVVLALQRLCEEAADDRNAAVPGGGEAAPAPVETSPATVTTGAPPAAGTVDPEAIRRALMAKNPGLAPESVSFTVGDDGSICLQIASDGVRDLSPVAALKELKALRLLARAESKPVVDLRPLTGLGLTELRIEGYAVKDMSPLNGIKLNRLAMVGIPAVSLMAIEGMPLTELDLSKSDIRDLTAVRGMRLERLWIPDTKVASLSLLVGMPLRELYAAGSAVRDAYALSGAPLEVLDLARTQIYDFSPLKGMHLAFLDASDTKIRDISFCVAMPLKTLLLRNTAVTDLTPLKGKTLERLDLSGSQVKEIVGLKGCEIKELNLSGTKLTQRDLAALAQVKVERLYLSGTEVVSLAFLSGKALTALSIGNTKVKDIHPLAGMPLVELDCRSTEVTDFSPLVRMPLQVLDVSADLRDLRDIIRTLPDLRTVNGFDMRERRARAGGGP